MLIRVYYNEMCYDIRAPNSARVVRTSGEDCLVYQFEGRAEYLLTPFIIMHARDNTKGFRLLSEKPYG
jgi:hypothetical protein